MTVRLVVVGGGRMGEALVRGLVAGGWAAVAEIVVVEAYPARRDELMAAMPSLQVVAEPIGAEGAVVAVKPGDVEAACQALGALGSPGDGGVARVLSIAAGVPAARIEGWLGTGAPVVRAMPNTPALVGAAASAISAGTAASLADLDWAESILTAVGTVVRVPETLLDAVTGLSGSGPAYVFLVVEALIEGGVLAGLPRQASAALATQTLLGAARLLTETGESAEALRAAVTSPGGTTAAGLRALESAGVRAAFLDAVMAATERSRQLGAS
jgi:pyrroline-5-carboxylate reductase